jgi:hypothetical protein
MTQSKEATDSRSVDPKRRKDIAIGTTSSMIAAQIVNEGLEAGKPLRVPSSETHKDKTKADTG